MKNNKNTEITTLTVDSLIKNPLISMMENSSIPWVIKDNHSRFIYIKNACMDFFNVPAGFDFEGKLDEEFPCPWSNAMEYKAHDLKQKQLQKGRK